MSLLTTAIATARATTVLAAVILFAPIAAPALSLLPGDIVVSAEGALFRIDPKSRETETLIDGSYGDFVIVGRDRIIAIEGNAVLEIDLAAGSRRVVSQGGLLTNPTGITVGADGEVVVLNRRNDTNIVAVDLSDGGQEILSEGGFFDLTPTFDLGGADLELDTDGSILALAASSGSTARVISVDPNDGAQVVVAGESVSARQPVGLGVSPEGEIYTSRTSAFNAGIDRVDRDTGEFLPNEEVRIQPTDPETGEILFGCEWNFNDVAVDHRGNLFIAARPSFGSCVFTERPVDTIISFDVETGEQIDYFAPLGGIPREIQIVPGVPIPEPTGLTVFFAGMMIATRAVSQRNVCDRRSDSPRGTLARHHAARASARAS